MKRIWSPWRMKYIQNYTPTDECPFCAALNTLNPRTITWSIKGKRAFVILNRYPYTTGHLTDSAPRAQRKYEMIWNRRPGVK